MMLLLEGKPLAVEGAQLPGLRPIMDMDWNDTPTAHIVLCATYPRNVMYIPWPEDVRDPQTWELGSCG